MNTLSRRPVVHYLPNTAVHLRTLCGRNDPPMWSRVLADITCKRCTNAMKMDVRVGVRS